MRTVQTGQEEIRKALSPGVSVRALEERSSDQSSGGTTSVSRRRRSLYCKRTYHNLQRLIQPPLVPLLTVDPPASNELEEYQDVYC